MVVIYVIIFLFPTMLSMEFVKHNFNKKITKKEYFPLFIKYNLFINLLAFGILAINSRGQQVSIEYNIDNIVFLFKYLMLVIIIAIVVPVIEEYINNNIDFRIIVKKVKKHGKTRETKKTNKNKNK